MKRTISFLLISLILFMFAVGFQQVAAAAVPSQEQQNMEVVKKDFEVFKTKDLDSMDNLMDKDEVMSGRNPGGSFVELKKGKQKVTIGDMKSTANAIRLYVIDHYKAPEAKTFAELQPILSPYYINILPLKDAWGNDFH